MYRLHRLIKKIWYRSNLSPTEANKIQIQCDRPQKVWFYTAEERAELEQVDQEEQEAQEGGGGHSVAYTMHKDKSDILYMHPISTLGTYGHIT